jgi:hypothetical protein
LEVAPSGVDGTGLLSRKSPTGLWWKLRSADIFEDAFQLKKGRDELRLKREALLNVSLSCCSF